MFLKNELGDDSRGLALTADQADRLFPVFTYLSLLVNAGRSVTASKKKKKNYGRRYKTLQVSYISLIKTDPPCDILALVKPW